jgi:hypothetical protein
MLSIPSIFYKYHLCSFIYLFYILLNFEAYICQIFTLLMEMGLKWYITTYQDMLEWPSFEKRGIHKF